MSEIDHLFDPPGPRSMRRIRIITWVSAGLLALAGALALRQFGVNGQLSADKWQTLSSWPIWRYLLQGLAATALAAAISVVLAVICGFFLALASLSPVRLVRIPARLYINTIRVIPGLLLIYIMLFALPPYGLDFSALWKLVIPITLFRATQFAEIFRAAINAVSAGQGEAGRALGLTTFQTMRHVVAPQAIRASMPSSINQLVGIVKDTSLGYLVSYADLLFAAKVTLTYTNVVIQAYILVALLYFAINYALSRLARRLERIKGVGKIVMT